MDPSSRRTTAISGILFVALAVIVTIFGGDADWDSTDASLRDFYDNTQQNMAIAAIVLLPFATAALLWFVAGLRSLLRQRDSGSGALPSAAALGGGVFAATFLLALTTANAVPVAMAFTDRYQFEPGVARLLLILAIVALTGSQAGAAVMIAATSAAGRRTGLLPTWFVWSGYVVAVLALFSVLLFAWPIALVVLWVLVLSIMLFRKPAPAGEVPGPRSEPAATERMPHGTST